MNERLIFDAAAEAAFLRQWLRHDAERAAASVWWGIYTPKEALEELQGLARLARNRASGFRVPVEALAAQMMTEAFHRHQVEYSETTKQIISAVLMRLQAGDGRVKCALAAANVAQFRPLPPPPHVVAQAVEEAARQHRSATAFWRKRATA